MFDGSTHCLSIERLRQYLDDELLAEELAQVEQHVQSCRACELKLSRLVGAVPGVGRAGAEDDTMSDSQLSAQDAGPVPQIPGYECLGLIGRGGMGIVWKARHKASGRFVAIKVMTAECRADPEQALRFQLEARVSARIDHPGVIRIIDMGEHLGIPWISLEYCATETTLQSQLGFPRTSRAAAELVELIAQGVNAAHQEGIVHRDLKPANILLDSAGRPKVADFGLASMRDLQLELTRTGSVMGTPPYMSPEQVRGQVHAISPQSDVYSLGVILFQLLTGTTPFSGTRSEMMQATCEIEPVWPARCHDVPRDLATIALRCLQKEPPRRFYRSAGELAEDLRRWRERYPIRARPVSWRERCWLTVQRNKAAVASAVLLLLAVTFGAAAAVLLRLNHQLAETREQLVYENTVRRLSAAAQHLADDQHSRLRADLDGCPDDVRHWEWHYLSRQCRLRERWQGHTMTVSSVDVSPDGKWIASVSHDQHLCLWQRGESQRQVIIPCEQGFLKCLCFHPDGRRVATGGNSGTVILWDLETGQSETLPHHHNKGVEEIRFTRDGRRVVTGSIDRTVVVSDLATGENTFTADELPGGVLTLDVSADSRLVAAAGAFAGIWVWELSTRRAVRVLGRDDPDRPERVGSLAFSPDGRWLASAGSDFLIRLWSVESGEEVRRFAGHTADINSVCWNARGDRLASAADDSTVRVWDVVSGRQELRLRGHTGHATSVVFHPDQTHVISGSDDHSVGLWNVDLPAEFEARGTTASGRRLSLHPVGHSAVICDRDPVLRLVDLEARTVRPLPLEGAVRIADVAHSPDGTLLAAIGEEDALFLVDLREERVVASPKWSEEMPTEPVDPAVRRTGDLAQELLTKERIRRQSQVCFTPDGASVLCACADSQLRLYDVREGRLRAVETGHLGPLSAVTVDSSGDLVATAGLDRDVRLWNARTLTPIKTLAGHEDYVYQIAFSPDGRWLASASADATARIWEVGTGKQLWRLTGHSDNVLGLAFTPDSRRLATASFDGTIKIWDLSTGRELLQIDRRPEVRGGLLVEAIPNAGEPGINRGRPLGMLRDLQFHPVDQSLVVVGDRDLAIFEVE